MQLNENNWTIPNILTIARILLTPCFVISYVDGKTELAWGLFLVAGITDAADGFLARVLHQRTRLGAMLDPLADKALVASAFLCLGISGWVPSWLVILVISRDVIIVGGLSALSFWGVDVKVKIRPSWMSKLNTSCQISLIVVVMLEEMHWLSLPMLVDILVGAVCVLTVVTAIHYTLRGLAMFPEHDAEAEGDSSK
ncbi:CDP-alcohol phosphatidyltransferase family protein [Desulfobaculum bizertense]|uniref:CDP-diacylglycerol--glycerol-3-phosphate 3-phosphatidyltransferase n=1 Tax=Desulfobaculum bizertense DSM 18034 TaxID=1121442 RepID=A0A1T4WWN4_9BACT|nr:CDP-alcohol phosphatidyltransferase family protein [Desulfobaculum bizertense]UIJ38614.1 CDP-alcohol phosphatidyltransferase family protein [Desulfobaculum bizertense]SKA81295.1 CDP-diacylglycerol--glycerol-3-phosphate 3-phosphatidyltransferase [Desulfobaculum bizertense DSM 18034]